MTYILIEVAVFQKLADGMPVPLMINRLVRRICERSSYEREIVQGFREQLWMISQIVRNISKMYIGPEATCTLHRHSGPAHQFSYMLPAISRPL
jgi:hypothetical protein